MNKIGTFEVVLTKNDNGVKEPRVLIHLDVNKYGTKKCIEYLSMLRRKNLSSCEVGTYEVYEDCSFTKIVKK